MIALTLWNCLPLEVRQAVPLATFCRQVKDLSRRAFQFPVGYFNWRCYTKAVFYFMLYFIYSIVSHFGMALWVPKNEV